MEKKIKNIKVKHKEKLCKWNMLNIKLLSHIMVHNVSIQLVYDIVFILFATIIQSCRAQKGFLFYYKYLKNCFLLFTGYWTVKWTLIRYFIFPYLYSNLRCVQFTVNKKESGGILGSLFSSSWCLHRIF